MRTFGDHFTYARGIAPESSSAATTGAWTDIKDAVYAQFILQTGNAGNGVINFKLQQAKDSGGNSRKDIAGASIVQIAAHATNNDNKEWAITVKLTNLDTENGFYFIAPVVTPAAASLISCPGILYRYNSIPRATNGLEQDVRVL